MKRKVHPLLTATLVVTDLLALWGAFAATGALRIGLNRLLPHEFTADLVQSLFPPMPLVAGCWLATLAWTGAYDLLGRRSVAQVARSTMVGVTVAMCLQIVVLFFFTREIYSRSLIAIFWLTSLVVLTASRELAFWALRRLKRHGLGAEPVAVIGTGGMARALARRIDADREPRFRFAGYLADRQTTEAELEELGGNVLGHVEKLEELINEHRLQRLFVTTAELDSRELLALLALGDRMGVAVERAPDLFALIALRVDVTELDGLPLLRFRPARITPWDRALKRSFDVAVSIAGLVALAPLLGLLALAVRLDSDGPALFRQRRMGRGGKHFHLLKLRTMHAGAEEWRPRLDAGNEASGPLFKIRHDTRITRLGAFLRRWSLDELPQLCNVFVGEMSLVGPRPLPVGDLTEPDPAYAQWSVLRRSVRPGMTGLWQVSGRSRLTVEDMARLDLYYLDNWSLFVDLRVLLRTIPAVVSGRGAY